MSTLLERQKRKYLKDFTEEELKKLSLFFEAVQNEYDYMKEDRLLMERSLDISSKELREKNDELKKLLEKERDLEKMKDEFLSIASHELRTPMTIIKGYNSLLLKWTFWELNDKQKEYIEKIQVNTNHLLNMVNDMLDTSKLEAGKMDIFYEKVFINDVILETISEFNNLFKGKNISVSAKLDKLEVETDKNRIKQVLINLMSNAYKFSNEWGNIEVELCSDNNNFRICVKDNGIWIKQENISKLFKKFSQIESHLNKTEKGTWLWLSICKNIIDLMNWNIWVESEYEKWSNFWFSLPIKKI